MLNRSNETVSAVLRLFFLFQESLDFATVVVVSCGTCRTYPRTFDIALKLVLYYGSIWFWQNANNPLRPVVMGVCGPRVVAVPVCSHEQTR